MELLTVNQTAERLNVSISFVYKLIQTKQLTHERRGRKKLVPGEAIEEYRSRTTVPASEPEVRQTFKHLFKKQKTKK